LPSPMNPPNSSPSSHVSLLKNDHLELQATHHHQFLIGVRLSPHSINPFRSNQPGESALAIPAQLNPLTAFFQLNSVLNLKHPKRKRWLFLALTGKAAERNGQLRGVTASKPEADDQSSRSQATK